MKLSNEQLEFIGNKVAETAVKDFKDANLRPMVKEVIKSSWIAGYISGEKDATRDFMSKDLLIGHSHKIVGGTLYVGDFGDEDIIFKDEDAFNLKGDKPCYIVADAFQEDGSCIILDGDLKEMIEDGSCSTYNSIMEETREIVREVLGDNNAENNEPFIEHLARHAFDAVEWQCISTYLNELDIEEEYEIFQGDTLE